MLVKAAPGLKVPLEERPRSYIAGGDPVRVPDTAYYRRMVDEGSLVLVSAAPPVPVAKPRKSERSDDT